MLLVYVDLSFSMQTRCGIRLIKVLVRKLNMFKIKPKGLLLTSKGDVATRTA